MNHHHSLSAATPAVNDLLTAAPILSNDNNNSLPYTQPQLLSLLMNSYMTPTSKPIKPIPSSQDQQRSYVNALVDVTVQAIASIWPSSNAPSQRPIANLNTFLHHILKHSRTTHSTLQLAIFYLFRIRPKVQERHNDVYISCGRRMFLAALICAHKFLQDKTYKNSAWSKVSGLDVSEINHAEKVMLQLLDYHLFVKKETYDQWVTMLQTHLHLPVPTTHLTSTSSTYIPSTLPSPTSSPPLSTASSSSTSSSPLSNIVHSAILSNTSTIAALNSSLSLNKMTSSNNTAFMMGMPTPVEDQTANISTSPLDMSQRKRKASIDYQYNKRRC